MERWVHVVVSREGKDVLFLLKEESLSDLMQVAFCWVTVTKNFKTEPTIELLWNDAVKPVVHLWAKPKAYKQANNKLTIKCCCFLSVYY